MNSEFPTLDLLDRYGLRTAFVILMLGARSATHFQHLHDKVIPLECRLPRNLFIALKQERERMLETGEGDAKRSSRFARPSDEMLLREFNRARRGNSQKPATLQRYYQTLLSEHSKQTPIPDGDLWNRDILVSDEDGLGTWIKCILGEVSCPVTFTFRLHNSKTDLPEGVVLPKGYIATKTERMLIVHVHLKASQLEHLTTSALLELPPPGIAPTAFTERGTRSSTSSPMTASRFRKPTCPTSARSTKRSSMSSSRSCASSASRSSWTSRPNTAHLFPRPFCLDFFIPIHLAKTRGM